MSLIKAGKDFARRLGKGAKTSLAVVGFATVVSLSTDAFKTIKIAQDGSKKKRVLVLPFDRLKLVNHRDSVSWLRSKSSDDALEEIEIQELVELIHEAAQDPQCVAIFGSFGNGRNISAGMSDIEEIRTALRVFRESHRVHREPNLSHETYLERSRNEKKRLFAYSDSFESLAPDNKDYYLASIFTHVHLQEKGLIGLHGMSASVPFLRKSLEKYGAKVHVYKHGPFKNAPNSLTETDFTKPHRQNVQNYLFALNSYMCEDIAAARKSLPFSADTWQLIHKSGSFTSNAAKKIGLIDYAPTRSPLDALIGLRKSETTIKADRIKEDWDSETDLESFQADEKVTLGEYKNIVAQRKKMEQRQWHIHSRLRQASQEYPIVKNALALFGYAEPRNKFTEKRANTISEKIALIQINGTIDGKRVRKVLPCLQKISRDEDVKALVVRIDSPGGTIVASETLLQELKALPQKVVFSFGNVSASGGYYIASSADRVFANRSTLTGSIGVYGVRFDLSDVVAQYGVNFGHISTSELALANNMFYPCSKQMHANSQKNVDKAYSDFLGVVVTGRQLHDDYVESIAGGRVYTGAQAKEIGLVDEIGGLYRAIAYARRNFTSGDAKVEYFSADQPFLERFKKYLSNFVLEPKKVSFGEETVPFAGTLPWSLPRKAFDVYLTIDENAAIRSLMNVPDAETDEDERPLLPFDFWSF